MNFDLAFRFRRALAPQGLRTIQTANSAILEAIQDCRSSGLDPEECPAVKLLSRHLRRIVDGIDIDVHYPEDARLRVACNKTIDTLRSKPLLPTLMKIRSWHDPDGKRAFHSESARALRALAKALRLRQDQFDLRSNKGGPAVSGEITLHSERIYVQISQPFVPGHEIMYRSVRGMDDYTGGPNHYAAIEDLADASAFAARIRKDLCLEPEHH